MSQLVVLWMDNIHGSLVWILVWPFMFSPILFHYNWISFSFSPKSLPVVDRASDWQKLMVFKSLSDVSIFLSYCYNTIIDYQSISTYRRRQGRQSLYTRLSSPCTVTSSRPCLPLGSRKHRSPTHQSNSPNTPQTSWRAS